MQKYYVKGGKNSNGKHGFIFSDAKGSYVYVVDRNDKVVRRDVKTGMIFSGAVYAI